MTLASGYDLGIIFETFRLCFVLFLMTASIVLKTESGEVLETCLGTLDIFKEQLNVGRFRNPFRRSIQYGRLAL